MHLDYDTALSYLRLAVEEKGENYVYVNPEGKQADDTKVIECSYVDLDLEVPSCIVGNVLHRAGMSLDTLARHEGDNAGEVIRRAGIEVEADAVNLLMDVQERQDKGYTWADAVRLASLQRPKS